MIEINLIKKRKVSTQSSQVMGINLTDVSIKGWIVALLVFFLPDFSIKVYWNKQIEEKRSISAKLETELRDYGSKIAEYASVKKQLDAYNEQMERLKKRSEQVSELLKSRSNPKKMLERIARNMPPDLWFDLLECDKDKNIIIKGKSSSYKSIGNLITQANDSSFFGKTIVLASSNTKNDDDNTSIRIEEFEIKGKVLTFDPGQ